MNSIKKIFLVLIAIVAVFNLGVLIYVHTGFIQIEKGSKAALRTFDPRTQAGKVSIARRVEIQKRIKQENIAWDYYQKGDYGMAIKEYKKTIEMSKHDQWVPRYRLSDVYEKAGYYDLALQEIDWLLSRKKVDQRVVDELLARKAKISSALPKASIDN